MQQTVPKLIPDLSKMRQFCIKSQDMQKYAYAISSHYLGAVVNHARADEIQGDACA